MFYYIRYIYYMHNNNNYQCKICWNKALTFGVGSIQLSFRTIVFTQYMQRCFQSKCYYISVKLCLGFHLSAFHYIIFHIHGAGKIIQGMLYRAPTFSLLASHVEFVNGIYTSCCCSCLFWVTKRFSKNTFAFNVYRE